MLKRLDLRGAGTALAGLLPRPQVAGTAPVEAVRAILADVRRRGDDALLELAERFDGVRPDPPRVPREEVDAALAAIPTDLRIAMEAAWANIVDHHRHQVRTDEQTEDRGLLIRELRRP